MSSELPITSPWLMSQLTQRLLIVEHKCAMLEHQNAELIKYKKLFEEFNKSEFVKILKNMVVQYKFDEEFQKHLAEI